MDNQQDTLKDKLIVGIDLGTTNSGISLWSDERQQVEILTDKNDNVLTPSLVGWDRNNQTWVVGHEAQTLSQQHPTDVVYSIKRYIGRAFSDPNVNSDRPHLAYQLIPGSDQAKHNEVAVDFGDCKVSAPELSAKILFKLRQDAALKLGMPIEEIKNAVITVPAYFNVPQREATKLAGQQAGLEDVRILNEPTAAALSYRNTVLEQYKQCRILVYDLGGGTFDISLLEFERDAKGYAFYTQVVDGDTHLGGDDIDLNIARWLAEELEKRYGTLVDPNDRTTRNRLRQKAEEAKIQLSTNEVEVAVVDLTSLDLGQSPSLDDAYIELSREQLEKCAADVIQKTLKITKRAVEDVAGLTWKEIDEVILVGWQTKMPAIGRKVEEMTGRKPHVSDSPHLAVALGAGEFARILSLGKEKFSENSLIDVLALPLGICLDDDTFKVLVDANKTLPYTSPPFLATTTVDNQGLISVKVLQGPRGATKASECDLLGFVEMTVLPAPKGIPKFEVVLHVQSDGTMYVEVTDDRTRKSERKDLNEPKKVWVNPQSKSV
ncbi:Hsp70 family protein [Nostoc sp.]|uniref:Hsp70 family protein n=1 Tax=Nostoc sp. TaxID=1180 RepID=UPI002FF90298